MAFDADLRGRLDQIVGMGTTATSDLQDQVNQQQVNTQAAEAKKEADEQQSALSQWQTAQQNALSKSNAQNQAANAKTQSQLSLILAKQAKSNAATLANSIAQTDPTHPNNEVTAGKATSAGSKYLGPSTGAGNSFDNFVQAIVSVESGGRYNAIGPAVNSSHAYGKYQIMGYNIPSWTKQALGKSLTPQQFLNNPKAQDQTALYFLSGYYKKYGPGGAAMAWNGGPGSVGHGLSGYALTVLKRMGLK